LSRRRLDSIAFLYPWMTNALLCLLGVGLVGLAWQYEQEHVHFWIGFNGVSAWAALLYLVAAAIVLTQRGNRATLWIVLGFAVAMRAMTVFAVPFSSSDIYRYVWDGIVQHAHINPYRYVPGNKALTFLRAPHQYVFDNINRRDYAHTIYPPVAQMIYYCVTFFSPTVTAMKIAMFGFECVAMGALVALLRRMGRSSAQVLLYAWCPLLVWEIGGSGHIDAAIIAFVSLALLSRYCGRPVWTGVFLGAAVLTKFYPLVLFPALWQRKDWKMPAVMVGMIAAAYAVYSSVGRHVFGFFDGYEKEEGMDSGTRYFLLDFTHRLHGMHWVSLHVFDGFCVVVMAGLCWWAWKRTTVEGYRLCDPTHAQKTRMNGAPGFDGAPGGVASPEFVKIAMCFAFALMLLFSPHYPWYIAWLIPFVALVPNLPLMVYIVAFFYLFTTPLADGTAAKMLIVNKILYGVVLVAAVLQLVWWGWSILREKKLNAANAGIQNS
jgi:alpha-1,6-mannosyltransferase